MTLTTAERWEDRAVLAFFFVVVSSALGAVFFVWIAPRLGVHSLFGMFLIFGILFCGLMDIVAGLAGMMAVAILFFRFRVISWRGLLAGAVAGAFLFLFR